jgi:tetratricopeptide (TPR) repeat protein
MSKVFLSHIRADRTQVRRLLEALKQAGHTPWIADDAACIGESMAETLARELRDTQAVVVLLSRNSVESAWTSSELALLHQHAPGPLRMYTVRLERVAPPALAAELHSIDLFPGETAWQSGKSRLLQLLEEKSHAERSVGLPPLPPNNLPSRVEPFVGREQELAVLHERLIASSGGAHAVLWGPHGMGKTALAVEYAVRHAADYPGGIWWVPAHLEPKRALAWLLDDVLLRGPPWLKDRLDGEASEGSFADAARALIQALEACEEPSLLVLDNLRGNHWLEYLPAGQVRVLATCRAVPPALKGVALVRHLRPLSRPEVDSLLAKVLPLRTEHSPDSTRDRLLEEWLRGSPLLVSTTARLLARTGMTWSTLERKLSQHTPTESGALPPMRADVRQAAVLDVCIEQFPLRSLARRMLEGVAVFAPAMKVDTAWVWAAALGEDPFQDEPHPKAPEALRLLEGSGLLQGWEDLESHCWSHAAVLQRVRALTPGDTRRQIVQRGLPHALSWAMDADGLNTGWEMAQLHPHLEAVLHAAEPLKVSREWVDTANDLADFLSRRGEHFEAKMLRRRALRRAEQRLGKDVDLLSHLRAKLAETYDALGDTAAARKLLERAVADDAANSRGQPGRKAQRLADLALLLLRCDQATAALHTLERALEIDREVLGSNDSEFPMRLVLGANILNELGHAEQAHALLEEALAVGERLAETRFVYLPDILEPLARSRRARGDEEGALALYPRLLDDSRRLYGEVHFETVHHLTELARTHAEFGRHSKTRSSVTHALSLLDKVLVPSDPRYGDLLFTLAESLIQVEERAEAHRLLERALDAEGARETPDVNRISRLVMAALIYTDKSNKAGTDALLEQALSLARRSNVQTLASARLLEEFVVHVLHNSVPEELPTTRSPLHTPSPGTSAEPLERALRLYRRSNVRDELKAEALEEALAAAQQGNDPANGARALFLLADLHGRRGAWEQARANARQGLQLSLRADLPALVVEGYRLLGDASLHGSFYEEARMSYEEAIRRYDVLGEHRRSAQTRSLLVTLLLQLGRHDGLEEHVRWLEAHREDPSLTKDDQQDLGEVLALASLRLSSSKPDARHPEP